MWLAAGNLGFLAGAALLYLAACRRLLRAPLRGRALELAGCCLVSALAFGGFALAHLGMVESWTGRARFADVRWAAFAAAVSTALFAAHLLLRLQRSRADQLLLPAAAFLAVLGLLNVYVWETRDANAYVTTVALPSLRTAGHVVPNELDWVRTGRGDATVLDERWLTSYNAAARAADEPGVEPVDPYQALRTQLLATVLGLLLVPALVHTLALLPLGKIAADRRALPLAAATLVATVAATLPAWSDRRLPALLSLSGRSITAYEPIKVGLAVVLAGALGGLLARGRGPAVIAALVAAGATVAVMAWLDPGAGLALLALAVVLVAFVLDRRRQLAVAAVGAVAVLGGLLVAHQVADRLPRTIGVRLEMWTDPWGSYERSEVQNEIGDSLERITAVRANNTPRSGRELAGRQRRPIALEADANRLEQELRWRLDGIALRRNRVGPLIPGSDPIDERLLIEAETLWTELGGYSAASRSANGRAAFDARVEDAISRLQREADRLSAGKDAAREPDDFQLQRATFALRKGNLLGVGLGRGRPETVPRLTEDVPLAGLGEMLGLAGVALAVLLLALVAGRGVESGLRERAPVRALLVVALAALLGLQALISLGGLVGLVPFTGLTFPFVSRSGTALVASFVVVGLLMGLARPVRRRRSPLAGGGFPAALALALASVAALQLAGRTVAGPLPDGGETFLHAADQWAASSYRVAPGPILDHRGRTLARSDALGGGRTYPDAELGRSLSHTLRQLDLSFHDRLRRAKPGRTGPAIRTTIDAEVQRAVHRAIDRGAVEAGRVDGSSLRGAVVVLDVKDGGLVAVESRPGFSPDEVIDPLAWAAAEARDRRSGFPYRYLNRAVHGFYPPGSIFKTVTAAAVLARGLHTLHARDFDFRHGPTSRRAPDGLNQFGPWHQLELVDGPPISDGNHPHLEDWHFDLEAAFAWSCNVAFAQMGLELGAADLITFARRFGFERAIRISGLGTSTSTIDNDAGRALPYRYAARSSSNLARTAFGQGQARVTPIQMVLVPAAIANRGTIMQPHILDGPAHVFARTGFSTFVADELQEMMWASATYGWATTARVNPSNASPGVAGKTGSAEWSEEPDLSHAWFIGYFPAEAPRLAIAVVIERGGAGPTLAARVARNVFQSQAVHRYVREAAS